MNRQDWVFLPFNGLRSPRGRVCVRPLRSAERCVCSRAERFFPRQFFRNPCRMPAVECPRVTISIESFPSRNERRKYAYCGASSRCFFLAPLLAARASDLPPSCNSHPSAAAVLNPAAHGENLLQDSHAQFSSTDSPSCSCRSRGTASSGSLANQLPALGSTARHPSLTIVSKPARPDNLRQTIYQPSPRLT